VRIRLQAEMIVSRIAKTPLAAQVSLGRLNWNLVEQGIRRIRGARP